MIRNTITRNYLDMVERLRMPANELVDVARREDVLDATVYRGRCLTRPVFLDRAEHAELSTDLLALHAALTELPNRLFGGDLGAFARAVGMTEGQTTAILRTRSDAPTRLGATDIYHDGTAFRLMELNMGSNVGGLDNAVLNSAFLTHPAFAEFAGTHGLAYVDTFEELAHTLLTECKIPTGQRPFVAAADWPATYAGLETRLKDSAARLGKLGIDIVPCHLGQLSVRDGRVWLHDRPVDLLYRIFLIEDLLDPDAPELIDPVLRAAERGEIKIFTPLDAELYGSKGALAMVSDEANRHLYTDAQLASLDRIVPWTRMVRPGPVTVEGEQVDLLDYAWGARQDLVLKPTTLHGGQGVVPGWLADPDEWRSSVTAALDGPFILQHRIRPEPEPFPAETGTEPLVVNWRVFLSANGYAGVIGRGVDDPDAGVSNIASGRGGTCCFHEAQASLDRGNQD
jgi:hypothetical protein